MLTREWGAESNRKLPHIFIPDKTAALGPEFAVEDLSLAEKHWVRGPSYRVDGNH